MQQERPETMPAPSRPWSYSLRGLFLLILFIGLALGCFVTGRRLWLSEKELHRLRNETGFLTITDRSLIHVVAIETGDKNVWRWRLFIPKGHRYAWRIAHKDIPRSGVPKHGIAGSSNERYSNRDNEVVVTATLRQTDDAAWRLSVTSKIGDATDQMAGAAVDIPRSEIQWMSQTPCTDGHVLGSRGTERLAPRGPIILLQRRACEQLRSGTYQPSPGSMPGILIWLEHE